MDADNLNPILLNGPTLPSFASLRERNLRTLYGDTKISEYINNDKSPKGSVDEKIRPLVNLINLHPEFVTLSSCSGRVAMFDPAGSCCDDHQLESSTTRGETMRIEESDNTRTQQPKEAKGTDISGKGRGKWIFVTHDILPDLGEQIIASLKQAGTQRLLQTTTIDTNENSTITFKHEPPLLHIAASSLAAGKKLLHLAKSTCAMRESGLVVTDQRVTVEIRTTGTLLCLPLLVQSGILQPNEDFLMTLADIANKRMVQNAELLEKLFHTIQSELFEAPNIHQTEFHVSFEPLPSLNLWKCASVAISPRSNNYKAGDYVEILAFGGQGTGPIIDDGSNTDAKVPSCRRWDAIFRLSRENGTWAKSWRRLPIARKVDSETMLLNTSAGSFEVNRDTFFGAREGHTACVLPSVSSSSSRDDGVVIFGGRTGGPTSPSNDLFIFKLQDYAQGVIGKPVDVRGSPPVPRFGHSMNALTSKQSDNLLPLVVVSGGYSGQVALSCIHTLSRSFDSDSHNSHFIWEHIVDMPHPRCYHTATVVHISQGGDELFVFGGMSEPDDPFSSAGKFLYTFPIQRGDSGASKRIIIREDSNLPESIGAAACSCFMPRDKIGMMLLSGGVQDEDNRCRTNEEAPFHIIKWKLDANDNGTALRPERALYTVTRRERELDLGSLAHHNILNLPCHFGASAVLVGGGVPSFSFGQSFARSFAINITSARDIREDNRSKTHRARQCSQTPAEPKSIQTQNNKNATEVIYVAPKNAKAARLELEKLGYFDSRYKLVKVEVNENDGGKKVCIGLPITQHCKSLYLAEGKEGLSHRLESFVMGLGKEESSFSSSHMSKMANRAN
eukprot:scaffold1748_cov148-Skeletonema_menzelii.AAC.13